MKIWVPLLPVLMLISCGSKESSTTERIDSTYVSRGNVIAKISFETISGELQKALADGGIENALHYCNERAYPITDSLAIAHGVSIKRVSNKNRNPSNRSDKVEDYLIKGFSIELSEGKELTPKLILKDDTILFYKPIITNALCLNCHGTAGRELTLQNDSLIRKLYPYDKAVGYQVNQLRGLWRIGFAKNNEKVGSGQ
jgi:hypothetical protein